MRTAPSRVIAFGRSLGCGAAIELARNNPVAGVIVEAPFLSAFRVLTHVRLLPWDKFNNARKLPDVRVPVLILHGRRDEVVPFAHGQKLFELADEPKYFVAFENARHNDAMFVAEREYLDALRSFAAKLPK